MNNQFLNFYNKKIVLASRSPRRRDIFKMIGLNFEISPSNYQEDQTPNKTPEELAKFHSLLKSKEVAARYNDAWIIGADTIVVLGKKILEKPQDRSEAKRMLKKLSDQTHKVMTGYTIMNSNNNKYLLSSETTQVLFQKLSEKMIEHYLDNYHYNDKAGSYAIQDFSALFVKNINGCFYNVVGFPVSAFCQLVQNNLASCL
ncbi:MAG: Maf family protein [Candidatus Marinimicrobia bacterium]|nr:Maf family protein [Candidatus Neomarinimicrobiota bacterium]